MAPGCVVGRLEYPGSRAAPPCREPSGSRSPSPVIRTKRPNARARVGRRSAPGRRGGTCRAAASVADLPVPLQQRAAERELAPFPRGERRVEVARVGGELRGQRPAVGRGLGRARRGVRPDRERGVADQADPAEAPSGARRCRRPPARTARPRPSRPRRSRAGASSPRRPAAPRRRSSTAPGGSDTARRTPSRPVISVVEIPPAATLRYQTKFTSRSPGRARRPGPGWGRRGCGCRAAPGR